MEVTFEKSQSSAEVETLFIGLNNLLLASTLPKQETSCDEPFEEGCFKDHILKVETNLLDVISILTGINMSVVIPKKVVICAVLLAGEHSKNENWTNIKTITSAKRFLTEIFKHCKHEDLLSLLIDFKVDSFLCELRPKLLKNSWKHYPAAVNCFMWILFHLKCPYLGDLINSMMPTCLLLTDDHLYSNKIKGLQCLQHLASNVSRTDLNQFGQGEVMYKAVEHMIYLREPEIIPSLATCLISLLSKFEHNSTSYSLTWNHFDDVLSIWLPSMEMEQKLVLREVYIDSLNGLLQAMGLGSARWSRKLLSIFSDYCEQEHTRNKSLKALVTFINSSWPMVSNNFQSIAVILMKVIIKTTKKTTSTEQSLLLVKQCFKQLEKLSNSAYNDFKNKIREIDEMNHCYLILTECEEM